MSSSDDTGKDAANRLEALQCAFRQELPDRVREVESLWQLARSGQDPSALADLAGKIHDLAGSSGSFGYPEIGEVCTMLQRQLGALDADPRAFNETRDRVANAMLQMLASTVASTIDSPLPLPAPSTDPAGSDAPLLYLLDDDMRMCEYLTLHLTQAGYEVEAVQTVAALKEALHKEQPAALLMDMMLPEGKLAGAKALVAIRAAHPLPLPVIFLSARNDLAARVAAVRAGADAYVTKPVDMAHLRRLLARLAGRAGDAPRVMIVDDDRFQGQATAAILETAGMQTHWLAEPAGMLQALQDFRPDLVLMDLYMPSVTGAELAAMIRQHLDWADLPVLFLSGETDPRKQARAMRRGGDDFLVKPIAPDTLIEAVSLRLRRAHIRRATSLLPDQQAPDTQAQLIQTLDDSPPGATTALMLVSLDNGEALSKALGLRGMDELILVLEKRIRQQLPDRQPLSRFAGFAFAAVLRGSKPDVIRSVAQRLCQAIAISPLAVNGNERYVSCSIGVAIKEPGLSGNELLVRADVAARHARENGANQVHVHDTQADEAAAKAELRRQATDIEQALAEGGMRLAFQPIVALKRSPPAYYEALVRLRDSANRAVAPAAFIPVAERTGLIHRIDRWVALEAMRVARTEDSMGGAQCYFIKLSRYALTDPEFPLWLEQSLMKSGQLGGNFTLQFLEQDLHEVGDAARTNLATFRKPGFHLLIDHFEGAERSLQLLQLVRPDFVRLSRQTMHNLTKMSEERDMAKELIRTVHALGGEVISAYVEDTQALAAAWQIDADYMQGFFAQPPSELMGYDFSDVVV